MVIASPGLALRAGLPIATAAAPAASDPKRLTPPRGRHKGGEPGADGSPTRGAALCSRHERAVRVVEAARSGCSPEPAGFREDPAGLLCEPRSRAASERFL